MNTRVAGSNYPQPSSPHAVSTPHLRTMSDCSDLKSKETAMPTFDTSHRVIDAVFKFGDLLGLTIPNELTDLQSKKAAVRAPDYPQMDITPDMSAAQLNKAVVAYSVARAAQTHQTEALSKVHSMLKTKMAAVSANTLVGWLPQLSTAFDAATNVVAEVSRVLPTGSDISAIDGTTAPEFARLRPAEKKLEDLYELISFLNAQGLYPTRGLPSFVYMTDAQDAADASSVANATSGPINNSMVAKLLARGFRLGLMNPTDAAENRARSEKLIHSDELAALQAAGRPMYVS